MRRRWTLGSALAAVFTVVCCIGTLSPPHTPEPLTERRVLTLDPDSWKVRNFDSKPATRYEWLQEDGVSFARSISAAAASMLIRHVSFKTEETPWLEWRWRVWKCPDSENLSKKSGNDCAARVLVGFKGEWSKANFFERRAVDQEIKRTGYEPPGLLLVYVWSSTCPKEEILSDPHLGDGAKLIVVSAGPPQEGLWVAVRRNLVEDFRRAFSKEPPDVVSIALMTDSDDTRSNAQADYAGISLKAK